MNTLPDDLELRQLRAAGLTDAQIADRYKVTQQAVSYRFIKLLGPRKGHSAPVLKSMPWDLSGHPDKRRLMNQRPFNGLRYFMLRRMGEEISERAERDLRYFLNHVQNGEVVTFDPIEGFSYVPRSSEDGALVVRWPEGPELTPQAQALFELREEDAA